MVITYYGRSYFKLTLGDLTIALNPPSKASKAFSKAPRFGADIALISTHTPDTDGPETVTLGDKEPVVIDSPGSYEAREMFFTGAQSTVVIDKKTYINTVYGFELDGIKIAFLGLQGDEKQLSADAREIASNADLLFVPVAGTLDLDPTIAYKTAVSFSPNVIIPYEYNDADLHQFLKEGGQDLPAGGHGKNEAADKATLKRRDLDGKQGFIMVLAPQG